ncbi:DUF1642 domain-containing protein [Lactococcus allomyrinae]|uniref:DUF1642 domain-containing protein n=1 Tax=Lactococcus allomyrinae TaxID=2419773 RepID=A0A387BFX4_9LACT|nr:DUF1642 domain-containing protein [Lactococcus allomyrinae]AYF99886.1 DUF1642 domain-containing protein [Lactococcus allomyrinae]
MTKTFEGFTRPDNGPITDLNNNFQAVLSQYRKFREYATELENKLKLAEEQRIEANNQATLEYIRAHEAKPLPVVPRFVADWYEENKSNLDYMIYETCMKLEAEPRDEFSKWFGNEINHSITTLIRMQDGYTVEQEQLFYLKHIEMSKCREKSHSLAYVDEGMFGHDYFENDFYPDGDIYKFTQQEIEIMEVGSYEQIPVPVESENEK